MEKTTTTYQTFKEIRDTLQNQLPSYHKVYICGGCIRDTILGKPVSDIDVFITTESFHESPSICFTTDLGWNQLLPELEYDNSLIEGVYEKTLKDGRKLQAIICVVGPTIEDIIHNFPVNISKCYIDIDNKLVLTDDFIAGMCSKKLDFSLGANPKYSSKIRTKYIDWKSNLDLIESGEFLFHDLLP